MKKLILGAAIVALAGCSTTGNLTQSAVNAAYVFDTKGNIQSQILSANLSQDEVNTVASAFTKIQALRNKIEVEKNILNLRADYEQAKIAYLSVEMVVARHIDDYTSDQKQVFLDAQLTAKTLNERVESALTEAQVMGYVNTALQLAALIK